MPTTQPIVRLWFKVDMNDNTLVPIDEYLQVNEGRKLLAVFAIYNINKDIQYVGYSRNVVASIRGILGRVGNQLCSFTRVMVFKDKRMATRAVMEEEAEKWINRADIVPPGNSVDSQLWSGGQGIIRELSPVELEAYEMLKLKMRKAMGDRLDQTIQSSQDQERRLKTIMAVEGDNWSEVISQQTLETLEQSAEAVKGVNQNLKQPSSQWDIVSPFANAKVAQSLNSSQGAKSNDSLRSQSEQTVQLTKENVDKALEQVRPYIIADGGNVVVLEVSTNGDVILELQGACIGCPSSSATIKMGIERSLKTTFGDKIGQIIALEGSSDQKIRTTPEIVNEHLDGLRTAISTHGAMVEVVSVDDGICEIKFSGPQAIGIGLQSAIRDKFHDVQKVVLV
eukprot:TRINITY_DN4692_c0_g1_i6.p1 TRINITY_DN4692_c0_g1~~TRINITY_DN4692_c0_g1_i6.p1  ORF type:complete len:395 (+),score=48.72 TRINITY_DN4692_c0_g1_i6:39-1223(+)